MIDILIDILIILSIRSLDHLPFTWLNKYVLFILIIFNLTFFSIQLSAQDLEQRYEFSIQKMGTTFRIITYSVDSSYAEMIIQKCWRRLEEIDKTFSDYRSDSEATKLSLRSNTDDWQPVSPDMWTALQFAHSLSLKTNGSYDITIGPLSKLWRKAIRRFEFPDEVEIVEAKNLVGYHLLELNVDTRSVRLNRPGMQLDFGSVAKGFAVDELFQILKQAKLERSLVDGGGDIYAGTAPPGTDGWRVKIASANADILLQNQAIASSGHSFKFLEHDGVRYSHIVDPHSGLGATSLTVVNITASTCMIADALASTLCILDKEASDNLLKSFPLVEIR